jgi:IS5 family transposase
MVLAICSGIVENWQVQGQSDPNRELLDAAALCRQLVPQGSVEAFLADHRKELFPDQMFEDLFSSRRGRPSIPADVVASVMVLQSLEGLSDRDAARALNDRISWKVACGLALDDEGFDYSVLTYWRTRLRTSERPERIFDAVREVVTAIGVLKGKTKRALDSTLLDDAVATQDTVTQLIAAIRRVRRIVPGAAQVPLSGHDYEASGKPLIAWDDQQAKDALVHGLVTDALTLLETTEKGANTPEEAEALGLLALVAGQDVEQGDDGTWRIARRVAKDRVISVVDPETRHMHKSRAVYRDGYKAHLAVEPETGIITAAAVTPANTSDAKVAPGLVANEPAGLEILADTAYGSAATRAELRARGHHQLIKPKPLPVYIPGGFTREDFDVDHEAGTVTCPAGHRVTIARSRWASFGARCRHCALRERCTRSSQGVRLEIIPHDVELVAARRQWRDEPEAVARYRQHRPMVERSIAWLVADGCRRVRYRGVVRNQLGLSMRAAALNLRRLVKLGLINDGNWRQRRLRGAQARVGKEGTSPTGSTQPGWPAHTLFMPALRFGHSPSLRTRTYASMTLCSTGS